MKPFLKWAGGKRWLTRRYPELFNLDFRRYLEPFVGSGAVFFHISPKSAIISDLNDSLMNLYGCIRTDHEQVHARLRVHARCHSDTYYYQVRATKLRNAFARAAQFLYLNRTCWNGLYRENLNGQFNVPRGTKNAVIFGDDDFAAVANLLAGARIESGDFASVISRARQGDFVFVDPPYTVRHNANGFVKYNESIFSWADQERLAGTLKAKSKCGANFLVTNAHHPSVTELYENFGCVVPVSRASVLSADSKHRGPTSEIVIMIGDGWKKVLGSELISVRQRRN